MIRTDQSPQFGTHVIRGFNHHRVKCIICTRFERERDVSDNASTDGCIYTQSYVKIPVLASILVNTVDYVLS